MVRARQRRKDELVARDSQIMIQLTQKIKEDRVNDKKIFAKTT